MNKVLKLAAVLGKGDRSSDKKGVSAFLSNGVGLLIMAILGSAASAWVGTKISVMAELVQSAEMGMSTLRLFYAVAVILCLFVSFPMIINMFYMSDDLSELLVMPLTSMQIVLARLVNLCPIFFVLSLIFTLPVGIGYAVTATVPASFYLALVLAFLSIPVISLSLSGILVIVLLTFVGALKNKDHLRVIGAILGLVALAAYYYFVGFRGDGDKMESAARVLNGLGQYAFIFPINFALKDLMEGFSVMPVVITLACSALFLAAFLFVADRLYLKGALTMMTTSGNGRILDAGAIAKESKKKSAAGSLAVRDFKMMRRNPAYLMTGFIYPFFVPVLTGAMVVFSFLKKGDASDMASLFTMGGEMNYVVALCVAVFVTTIALPTSAIINTPLSREGESFMLLKQYPIEWKEFISAKQRVSLGISHASSTVYTLIIGIVLLFLKAVDIPSLVYMLVIQQAFVFIVVDFYLLRDLKHPHLVWESEAAMIKKANGPIVFLFILIAIGVPMGLFLLMLFEENLLIPVLVGISVVCVAAAVFLNIRLYSEGTKALEKL